MAIVPARLLRALALSLACVLVNWTAAFSPPAIECSLNGFVNSSGLCLCDSGWKGDQCGQLDLLPAPPLSRQVSSAAAMTLDNAFANATWGMSVIGPVQGTYHGYMTEIANDCMLADYDKAACP